MIDKLGTLFSAVSLIIGHEAEGGNDEQKMENIFTGF